MVCQHCLDVINEKLEEHLSKCKFNPDVKACATCEHAFEAGSEIFGPLPGCRKKLDPEKNKGGCLSWELER